MREELIKVWSSFKEKLNTKIATLNTEIQKHKDRLLKQGTRNATVAAELRALKEFMNLLFAPQNKPLILIKSRIPEDDTLRRYFGNYYQFNLVATWKIEQDKLVIKSVRNGQMLVDTIEKGSVGNYSLGKLAFTENEPVLLIN